ncbi:MAG: acylneuraminate cytidylyltransferase [Bacteroidales bacterium]|nr:acylneuraminate cytidylyltransferase [Bacteroidales bacterium]
MTLAFIPVRGGSKSIPLKNIRLLCGKPLVCWNIEALEACPLVDRIVVATDSDRIEEAVVAGHYAKTEIYHRSPKNAQDTSSTESVMLEYIENMPLADDDIFMLVQATSPLTATTHFQEALTTYASGSYDSMLTCVPFTRFLWNKDGSSKNYDYRHRPRRQDFEGEMMENGAFYISTVGAIKESGNRLSGRIGIYAMPPYTATEIDEPDDWPVIEALMRKYRLPSATSSTIKLFLSDVDGVLTDAGMYYSEQGDELKKFNTHDGMGFNILSQHGIKTGIITSEDTAMVARRAKKLHIDFLRQGQKYGGKLQAAIEICRELGITLAETAYIGDDINCYELLSAVGIAACPSDAVGKVKAIPGIHIMSLKGGEGAVREFIETCII